MRKVNDAKKLPPQVKPQIPEDIYAKTLKGKGDNKKRP